MNDMRSALTQQTHIDLADLLPSFERHLRSGNKSPRTIQSYTEAATKLIDFLEERGMPAHTDGVHREHVEAFIEHQLQHHADTTAALRYRSLRQFFRWLAEEGEIATSPMERMKPPSISQKPVPVIDDDTLRALLRTCGGRHLEDLRDLAILRLFIDTGCRLSEMASLNVDDVDLKERLARVHGKGAKARDISYGPKTATAIDRYLRIRRRHRLHDHAAMWLAMKGRFTSSGIAQMLERRCVQAGIPHLHPHQFRHTAAHAWLVAGGNEGDLMRLAGWSSRDMLNRYGASAADLRARDAYRKLMPGDRV